MQTFLLYKWILQKKNNFRKFANFFADSKSRAQELSNDVSFVTFRHKTWDLEGGGANWFSSTPAGIWLTRNHSFLIKSNALRFLPKFSKNQIKKYL